MEDTPDEINEPRRWRRGGWTARVVKNEEDDGWAVEMLRDGNAEPALVGPWTMGRDKKNPKPLDHNAFNTLVRTATEFVRRSEQHARAQVHKTFAYTHADGRRIRADLDIEGSEDDEPRATVVLFDAITNEEIARKVVPVTFRLTAQTVDALLGGA